MTSVPVNIKNEAIPSVVLADIAIVGGGFAGCLAAITLGRAGHKVTLIDINSANTALFRAEKISGDQLSLLQELGLLDEFKKVSTRVMEFIAIRGREAIDSRNVEEYGLLYPEMIDLLRRQLPPHVQFKTGKVVDIQTSPSIQRVSLSDGETIDARLVVLATGHAEGLRRKLGFDSRQMHATHTLCAGFSLKAPASGSHFQGLAAYGERCGDNVDYIAIFPLGPVMRANLFMFSDIHDPRIHALRQQGLPALFEILPGLRPWLQDYELASDVAVFPVELYRCDNVVRDGIVLISDAFRTSCPAVGTGLSCALTDVIRLCHHAEQWLKTPGMEAAKIAAFYTDSIKASRDESAHKLALKRRKRIMQTSLLHRLYLTAYYTARRFRHTLRSVIHYSVAQTAHTQKENSPQPIV